MPRPSYEERLQAEQRRRQEGRDRYLSGLIFALSVAALVMGILSVIL